jgi:hypothetical protein
MRKEVGTALFFGLCAAAMADEQGAATASPAETASPAPVVKIIRQGHACYQETTTQKMVAACYEGKTYYTPLSEKTRVKIKCPAKTKAHE